MIATAVNSTNNIETPVAEILEPRLLLSASYLDGLLTIEGTDFDDNITIKGTGTPGQVVVLGLSDAANNTPGSPGSPDVTGDDPSNVPIYYNVSHIVIDTGDGNDTITINPDDNLVLLNYYSDSATPIEIYAGHGDDTVIGSSLNELIVGGPGTDQLIGNGGVDHIRQDSQGILSDFESEQALKQWFIDSAVQYYQYQLGTTQYYYPYPYYYAELDGGALPTSDPNNYSNTNTQELNVDEGDLVKTNGNFLFMLIQPQYQYIPYDPFLPVEPAILLDTAVATNALRPDIAPQQPGELVIVDSREPEKLHTEARMFIDGTPTAMYLIGDQVLVLSQKTQYSENVGWYWNTHNQTIVTTIDITDPANPRVTDKTALDGWLVTSRAIDGKVYLVTTSQLFNRVQPIIVEQGDIDPNDPNYVPDPYAYIDTGFVADPGAPGIIYPGPTPYPDQTWVRYEDEQAYRQRLSELSLDELLPAYTADVITPDSSQQITGTFVDPEKFYTSTDENYLSSITSILTFDLNDNLPGPSDSLTIADSFTEVYASTENLFLVDCLNYHHDLTRIHKLNLDDGVEFAATGLVVGHVLNQFSMDEENDYFRIATTVGWQDTNHLFILNQTDYRLKVVGQITNLAPGERIYSARLQGDRGFIVTFRQVDPLFALDLSDPTNPQVAGILKIPGFSNYLQLIDDPGAPGLVGLGRDENNFLQLSLFDISDLYDPTRLDTFTFDENKYSGTSEALYDHHAINYYPGFNILAMPFDDANWYQQDAAALEVFEITVGQGIELLGEIYHKDDIRRSMRVGKVLYSFSSTQIKAHVINDPSQWIATLNLDSPSLFVDDNPLNRGPIRGDLNNDGQVNLLDLVTLGNAYNNPANLNPNADINRDGLVDLIDLAILGENYNKPFAALTPPKTGDTNRDGLVNLLDLTNLSENYNIQNTFVWSDGDFNNDGTVDLLDLTLLSNNYD